MSDAETAEAQSEDAFLRAAHPVGRLSRPAFWSFLAVAISLRDVIGPGVSVFLCLAAAGLFLTYRDRTPEARPNGGWFWRVAEGERAWTTGAAPESFAQTAKIAGGAAMGLALGGVLLTAWLGPAGLGVTLAYLIVTAVRFHGFATLNE